MSASFWWELAEAVLLAAWMIPISSIDIRKRIIPNKLVVGIFSTKITILLLKIVAQWGKEQILQQVGLVDALAGLAAAGAVAGLCRLVAKEGIGMGDVKLLLALGWYQGLLIGMRTLALTSLAALPVAAYQAWIRKAGKEQTLPFAPFLGLGAMASQILSII